MLPEEIRRQAKSAAVEREVLERFRLKQEEMLASFRGLSPERKKEELRVLIILLGASL